MAYYYIDNTNGNNARDGLRIPAGDHDSTSYYTIDSTADTTHFVDAALIGNDVNGSYFYNVTRSLGSLISGFVALTGTVTLADAIAGMLAGDEYYILNAWQTVLKASSTSPMIAGDTAYIRANQTHTVAAAIGITNDGTATQPISFIGCNATQSIDPWHDASDVNVVLDFNNNAYYFSINADVYIYVKNITLYRCDSSNYGALQIVNSIADIYNCVIKGCPNGSNPGAVVLSGSMAVLTNCTFENNDNIQVLVDNDSNARFYECTWTGGVQAPTYGIQVSGGEFYLENCIFTNAEASSADIYFYGNGRGIVRNTQWGMAAPVTFAANNYSILRSEDDESVFGDMILYSGSGTVEKSTTVRVGGSTSSALMIPYSGCSAVTPLTISGDIKIPDFKVWCASGAQTITVYVRGVNWAAFPTAAQLYLEAEYVTDDTTEAITRSKVVSTEVLTDNTTWVGLTCAVNPHIASFVNLKVYLELYEDATTGVLADIAPVIS